MNDNDKSKFLTTLVGLSDLYGKDLSEFALQAYWRVLSKYDLQEFICAVDRHVADPDSGQYMPKPADIVRNIEGTKQDRSMIAWTKVDRAVRQTGSYYSVCFDDPIIHAVISDMGGWISLCSTKTFDDFNFKMHEFSKRYRGYLIQGGAYDYPCQLMGIVESDNSSRGLESRKHLKYIGDKDRAMLVKQKGIKDKPRIQSFKETIDDVTFALENQKDKEVE